MKMLRPDDLSGLLEAQFNIGRSSRYGLRRHRIFHAAAAGGEAEFLSPLAVSDAAEAARRSRRLRLVGRDAEAAAGFTHALSLDSNCAAAWGWSWEARWNPDASLSGIERAVRLEPAEPIWRVWLGLAVLGARVEGPGSVSVAKRHFEDALSLRESPLAWAGLSLAEARGARFEAAASAAGKALKGDDRQGWLYRLRAGSRLRAGDEAGFLADCRRETLLDEGVGMLSEVFPSERRRPARRLLGACDRFLARRPQAHWMLVLRGDIRRSPEINDFAGALADFQAAAALEPGCAFTQGYLSRALMVAGKPDAALEAIDRAIARAPDSGWLRVWRGELRRRLGGHAASLIDFDAGLRLDPDYEMGYAWRGGALRLLGKTSKAIADLDLAAALDPNYAWTFSERSLALRASGRMGPALRDLESAVRLDPKYVWCQRPQEEPAALALLDGYIKAQPRDPWGWAWRGESRLRMSNPAGAVSDLKRAAALNPRLGWPRAWLGQALVLLGRPKAALRAFDQAVARDERYAPALAERGRLLLSLGRTRAAWQDLGRAAAAGPISARIWQLKGEAGLRLRRWKDAADDFTKALELERGWRPRLARAAAYEKLGWRKKAREDLGVVLKQLDEAVVSEPTAGWALALRGELKRSLGRPREGLEDVLEAVRQDKDFSSAANFLGAGTAASHDPALAWAYAWRGAVARREERWVEARADLDKAVALDPSCFWARAWAGELRLARGEVAAALVFLAASVKQYPRWADSQCWLGRALCAQGRCVKAQMAFKTALRADPRHVWAWIGSGLCSERRGRASEARRALEQARSLAPGLFGRVA